jgi:hypothetical protein
VKIKEQLVREFLLPAEILVKLLVRKFYYLSKKFIREIVENSENLKKSRRKVREKMEKLVRDFSR